MRKARIKMVMYGYQIPMERPERCANCRYWKNRRLGCVKGMKDCPYLLRAIAQYKKCKTCSYHNKGEPCVSAVCYRDMVAGSNKKRR